MFRTFWEEIKHIGRNKWRAASFFVMLFIPLIYGFLYMNAYWAPFQHVDQLQIIIVNEDKAVTTTTTNNHKIPTTGTTGATVGGATSGTTVTTAISRDSATQLMDAIYGNTYGEKTLQLGSKKYNVKLLKEDLKPGKAREGVYDGKYSAAIVIPQGYSKAIKELRKNILTALTPMTSSTTSLADKMKSLKKVSDLLLNYDSKYKVQFVNSYKHNYLAGEMTNFGAGLATFAIKTALSSIVDPKLKPVLEPIVNMIIGKKTQANAPNTIAKFVTYNPIGGNVDSYGFGLSPYFISIALWAGSLVMTFVIKNDRMEKRTSTIAHYFGKTMMWLLAGFLQTTILMTAITIQGVIAEGSGDGLAGHAGDQIRLFLWAYFMSTIFILFVQGVSYSFRYGDLGEFAVVILLVLQLISSSGTFPVEMQNVIFKIFNPIVPFTYSINGLRELLSHPDAAVIYKNAGYMLLFPLVSVSLALALNIRFDHKTRVMKNNVWYHEPYEIHLGDM